MKTFIQVHEHLIYSSLFSQLEALAQIDWIGRSNIYDAGNTYLGFDRSYNAGEQVQDVIHLNAWIRFWNTPEVDSKELDLNLEQPTPPN